MLEAKIPLTIEKNPQDYKKKIKNLNSLIHSIEFIGLGWVWLEGDCFVLKGLGIFSAPVSSHLKPPGPHFLTSSPYTSYLSLRVKTPDKTPCWHLTPLWEHDSPPLQERLSFQSLLPNLVHICLHFLEVICFVWSDWASWTKLLPCTNLKCHTFTFFLIFLNIVLFKIQCTALRTLQPWAAAWEIQIDCVIIYSFRFAFPETRTNLTNVLFTISEYLPDAYFNTRQLESLSWRCWSLSAIEWAWRLWQVTGSNAQRSMSHT